MTLTIGSLFSGYGGLETGIGQVLDAAPVWHCEWDDAPSKILAHHWPDVPNYRDVTTVDWAAVPSVDIIAGGSPCQDLSLAGARRGMTDGTRSNLWVAMREAIATIRPRLVVWENVLGALSATAESASDMEPGTGLLGGGTGHLRALGRVLGDLAEIGYDASWTTLRASDVGAPHHRARVFLIAYPADTDRGGLRPGAKQSGSESAEVTAPVCHAGTLPAVDHLPTPNASDGSGGGQPMSKRAGHSRQLIDAVLDMDHPYLPTPVAQPSGNTPENHLRKKPGRKVVTDLAVITENGLMATGGRLDGERCDTSVFGKYEPVVHRWEQVTSMPAPAPTELNKNGRPRLNSAFAEWLMGLPPGWITQVPGVTRAQQLKAAGNGVVPQQAAAALRHLLEEA